MNNLVDVPWEHCGDLYVTRIRIPLNRLGRLTGVLIPEAEWSEFLDWLEHNISLRYRATGALAERFVCARCGYTVDVGAELRCHHKIWRMTAKLLD